MRKLILLMGLLISCNVEALQTVDLETAFRDKDGTGSENVFALKEMHNLYLRWGEMFKERVDAN